ncbi:MAG: type II toxin-antitoxin system VapC family toxin [Anaerolineales bacterium]
MKVLLDTHTFLWWNTGDAQLSARARDVIAEGSNEVFISAASAWEIAIKAAKGRLILPEPPSGYIPSRMGLHRFRPLPVQIKHAAYIHDLPRHHEDPFDRLLVAQCQMESLPILTADSDFALYGVDIIW